MPQGQYGSTSAGLLLMGRQVGTSKSVTVPRSTKRKAVHEFTKEVDTKPLQSLSRDQGTHLDEQDFTQGRPSQTRSKQRDAKEERRAIDIPQDTRTDL